MKRCFAVLVSATFLSIWLYAGSDPFVGHWVYNVKKSSFPKDSKTELKIEDAGQNSYRLHFPVATVTLPLDGSAHRSADSGATLSLKQVDDHTWQYTEAMANTNVSTFSVNGDTMTWHLIVNHPNGDKNLFDMRFRRVGSGRGFVGDWISEKDSFSYIQERPEEMLIETFGTNGLSMRWTNAKDRTALEFDGKPYPDQGPNVDKSQTSTGKPIDAYHIEVITKHGDKVVWTDEMKVSDDGRTLTDISRNPAGKENGVVIWDRR